MRPIKFDDVADAEFEHIRLVRILDLENCEPRRGIFTQVFEDDVGLDNVDSKLSLVRYENNDENLVLIFIAAGEKACSLVPPEVVLPQKIFNRVIRVVDGWLVTGFPPPPAVDPIGPYLWCGVVRKRKWIAAGRPKSLDMAETKAEELRS